MNYVIRVADVRIFFSVKYGCLEVRCMHQISSDKHKLSYHHSVTMMPCLIYFHASLKNKN